MCHITINKIIVSAGGGDTSVWTRPPISSQYRGSSWMRHFVRRCKLKISVYEYCYIILITNYPIHYNIDECICRFDIR